MISEFLKTNTSCLLNKIATSKAQWDQFIDRLKAQEQKRLEDYYDERVWTFLIMSWYAYQDDNKGVTKLLKIVTGNDSIKSREEDKIWLEALPLPPRKKEGNTSLDLALGNIAERKLGKGDPHSEKKGNGIKYSGENGYICFCEMKWYSDIDTKVTHDKHRNQLIRIIENALCFQNEQQESPEEYYVTLVTPSIFKERNLKSRFYAYKFEEYKNDKDFILKELDSCVLDNAKHKDWKYPEDIQIKIQRLKLNWITFEDLIGGIEDDELGKKIKYFHKKYCGYL